MGILRLLLALSVLVGHAKSSIFGVKFVYGIIAVQSFYVISGFYMALILTDKYVGGANSYRLFLTNRLLRLFPTYWAIVAMIILFNIVERVVIGYGGVSNRLIEFTQVGHIGSSTLAFLAFVNAFIVGQDFLSFAELNVADGTLDYSSDPTDSPYPGYTFLYIPQAWTVGIELWFYLVAPFFVKRSVATLVAIVAGSLAVRFTMYHLGFEHGPWIYRFFPTELAFFLGGVLAYRAYTLTKSWKISRGSLQAILVCILLFTVLFYLVPVTYTVKQWIYYGALLMAVPFVFRLTKDNSFDRALADLSYPVYLSHIFVIGVLTMLGAKGGGFGLMATAATIVLAAALVRFVETPVDAIRQKRVAATYAVSPEERFSRTTGVSVS
jgi:peptidoglycan/LPS O-acetylase OafA/YrhL